MRRFAALFFLLGSCSIYYHPDPGPDSGNLPDSRTAEGEKFRSLADAYIAWHYGTNPTRATSDGVHDHDAQLGRFSRLDFESHLDSLRVYLGRVERIDRELLELPDQVDLKILENHIRASLLEVEKIRTWEKDPNFYREIISGGLYSISSLAFDTPDRRMGLVADRLGQVPAVLAWARENLGNPPRIYTEIALEQFTGTHRFIRSSLPLAFSAVKDDTVRKRFMDTQRTALDALERFVDWMRRDLLERSAGTFAIGPENYSAKLRYEEMVETPLEELLKRGYEILRATQEEMKRIAADKPVRTMLRETSRDHPPAEKVIEDVKAMMGELKKWASTVVDVPADAQCKVQETPEFRRSLSFASMEIPGPFETVAKDAYYSITLPDPSWTPERQEQHLTFFNRYTLPLISAHEAFPGHYTQFLAVQSCPSKVRKAFGSASFSEGWAHYCEQLYVERPDATAPLRLHQLSMALLRICRYIAGIEMHTKGMTLDQAEELFVKEGYVEREVAQRESRRGTSDPTYLVYTLGKMEILKLRDEYVRRTGRSIREFHNEFIRHGYPPIPLVRRLLLGD